MIIFILCGILGSILGFGFGFLTAAWYYSSQAQKAKRQWDRQKADMEHELSQLRSQSREQEGGETAAESERRKLELENAQLAQQVEAKKAWLVKFARWQESQRASAEASAPQVRQQKTPPPAETEEERIQRLHQGFAPVESLKLQFRYSFPDEVTFQPGSGYLRNRHSEVVPDASVIQRSNNATGYAMEGLFRVYDVIYCGKEYTFQQVMDGEMGNRFVRIVDIPLRAQVTEAGYNGNYRLARKGKLEVVDIQ